MSSARKAMAMITQGNDGNNNPEARSLSDRLSCLPESIIYRIFSFLDANHTLRLSLVSKKFKQLCLTTPYLHFLADFDRNYGQDEKELKTRYTQFCNYVDKVMRSRDCLKIEMDRFVIHWFSKAFANEGCHVITSWVRFATNCNVKELDILLQLDWRNRYSLPETVIACQSLRVLRLNLQMGLLDLVQRDVDSIEELFLGSVTIPGRHFGERISNWWPCLKRLNLREIHCVDDLVIDSSSLEVFKISDSGLGRANVSWCLTIRSSSLKTISISNCLFIAQSYAHVRCLSLENFSVYGSVFNKLVLFRVFNRPEISESDSREVSSLLKCFGVFGSYFNKTCRFCISYPTIKHINVSNCKFEERCVLNIDSSSLQDLTISNCEITPRMKNFNSNHKWRIFINSKTLEELTLKSLDEYLYEFPLSFSTPSIKTIRWRGNPVDFRHLESFIFLEEVVLDIKPTCQHKSRELACRCNLFKSSIYCIATLLESVKLAKALKINIWPIEIFFMQNKELIYFDKLELFTLMVDILLPNKLPVISFFLKGLPNLTTLVINCEKPSHVLGDPNFINRLGLHAESFSIFLSKDWKNIKIQSSLMLNVR